MDVLLSELLETVSDDMTAEEIKDKAEQWQGSSAVVAVKKLIESHDYDCYFRDPYSPALFLFAALLLYK